MKKFSIQLAACLGLLLGLASCDLDYNELTTDLTGDTHFGFDRFDAAQIDLTNNFVGPIQSNNQALNPLGVYNDPLFGKTKAHFVTQVDPGTNASLSNMGSSLNVTKATLKIPYFAKWQQFDSQGNSTYSLDSVHNIEGKLDLKVFRTNYYLNSQEYVDGQLSSAVYYTDQTEILNSKVGNKLNNSDEVAQNTEFFFDKSELREDVLDDEGEVVETLREAPAMVLDLDKNAILGIIQSASPEELSNTTLFKNHFRGLLFEVEEGADAGAYAMLNFLGGTIEIEYTDSNYPNGTTITWRLTGNRVSIIERENAEVAPQEDRFYLKGGPSGYLASMDLFGPDTDSNGKPDLIDQIIAEGWIINEANLEVHIDQEQMQNRPAVPRITVVDNKNNLPVLDYYYDSTTLTNTKNNKYIFNGLLEKGNNGEGLRYKIRLTSYLKSLVQLDSTNFDLGLVVTEDINTSYFLKTRQELPTWNSYVPGGHLWHPYGTVLYGPNIAPNSPDYSKRLKLNIFYSKPD